MGSIDGACCSGDVPPAYCEWVVGGPPTIEITGMTAINDGYLFSNNCCFQQCFNYDATPSRTVVDVGDIYTYDRTITCKMDMVYFPYTCGTVTQAFYTDPADLTTLVIPTKPAYVGCCPDPVTVNELTKTNRIRGGVRFAVSSRPGTVCVSVQRVVETCSPNPPVEKFILTYKQQIEAYYTYIPHVYDQTTYAYTDTNTDCWNIHANSESGGPFPYVLNWNGVGTGIFYSVCRSKILDSYPVNPTSYTFADADLISEPCVDAYDVDFCDPCVAGDTGAHCVTTGDTGPSSPSTHFCDTSSIATTGYSLGTIDPSCYTHSYYYWADDGFGGADLRCDGYSSYGVEPCSLTYYYDYAVPFNTCEDGFPVYLTCAGFECVAVALATSPLSSCFIFPTCDYGACTDIVGNPHQDGPANYNQAIGTVSVTWPNALQYYSRIRGTTRTVSCTGYVERSYCFSYANFSITLNPSPMMRDFGEAEFYLLGDMA